MATAKPAAKTASSSAKKPAAPAKKAIAKATPAEPAAAKQGVVKPGPGEQAVAKSAAKPPLKKPAEKPVTAKKSPVAKSAQAGKVAVSKPEAKAVPTVAKPQPGQTAPAHKALAKPTPAPKPAPVAAQPMKTPESKTSTASKPAKAAKKSVGTPLTDADIMAMSDADYMNDAQLAFFKAKLEAMRDEILENARETGEHLKENEVFADPNDRATVEEENLLEQRVRDRERKLLKKINASLARIEEGTYGYCLETGDPIGIPRLLARPTAELSIEAQEKHERLEKLYAD